MLNWRKNLSTTDRIIRSVIGLFLVLLVFEGTVTGVWAKLALAAAFASFVEAILSY